MRSGSAVTGPAGAAATLSALVRACHPAPSATVTAIAVALAASTGRPAVGVAAVGAAVGAGQLSVGWHNDWLDATRDRAARRSDKPVATGDIAAVTVGRAAAAAAVATVGLSLLSGWRAGAAHIGAVAVAWSYNGWLKATVWSFVPYAVSFGLLVAFVTLGRHATDWPPWWALVSASTLGVGAHLANAAPDIDVDRAAGGLGLPVRLGRTACVGGACILLLGASVLLAFAGGSPGAARLAALAVATVLVVVGLALGRRPGSRALFVASLGVAVVDVALLISRGHAL